MMRKPWPTWALLSRVPGVAHTLRAPKFSRVETTWLMMDVMACCRLFRSQVSPYPHAWSISRLGIIGTAGSMEYGISSSWTMQDVPTIIACRPLGSASVRRCQSSNTGTASDAASR